MEPIPNNNVNRAPGEIRPQSGSNGTEFVNSISSVRPPLIRTDSRSAFPTQSLRPNTPQPQQQQQQRPQFQTGGPVTNPPQFGPRSGPQLQRGPVPTGPPGSPQIRPQPPQLRPLVQQGSLQSPRPLQSPTVAQQQQRGPVPPNNLQFGPRQPPQFGSAVTPDGTRPQVNLQSNGTIKQIINSANNAQISKQPSQGSLKGIDLLNSSSKDKPANLDKQNVNDSPIAKFDDSNEGSGTVKARSFSIAAAPGMPSPFKTDEERRKSVSSVSGRFDDSTGRGSGLGLIQEIKSSTDNIRNSKESIRSESYEGNKDIPDRPESRMTAPKMAESFMGSLSNLSNKKKIDDDDDVVLQNNLAPKSEDMKNKVDLSDRSPSLTRSDDSPELKNGSSRNSVISNKSPNSTPEPKKMDLKEDIKPEPRQSQAPAPLNKVDSRSNVGMPKSPTPVDTSSTPGARKPNELNTAPLTIDSKKSTPRKIQSAPKSRPKDGDNDSGVDESTQGTDINGSPGSPTKKTPSKLPTKEKSSLSRSSSKSATVKTPENPLPDKKKVPMNKVQVGSAPSPNIKTVKSKIGSLNNTTYKPGGGKVKIENRKLDFNNAAPKIAAKNDAYTPQGGSKKITTTKLEWTAKSKIGSLQNAAYRPGGGDKKIETVKLDFKEKAKPKVASTANITHKPGGGDIKIEYQKLDFKAQSKIGSLDNVKHKPGGGDVKIFDDKEYMKQISGQSPLPDGLGQSRQESDDYMSPDEWGESERPLSRSLSARTARTPRTPRALSPQKLPERRSFRRLEPARRQEPARPASARAPPRSSRRPSLAQRPAFTVY